MKILAEIYEDSEEGVFTSDQLNAELQWTGFDDDF
jgi:hypothetical protein